jgi:hypothetical protein
MRKSSNNRKSRDRIAKSIKKVLFAINVHTYVTGCMALIIVAEKLHGKISHTPKAEANLTEVNLVFPV